MTDNTADPLRVAAHVTSMLSQLGVLEDALLQKLRWYRLGGETSDRQWRDVLGVIQVQGERLDREYLTRQADRLGVTDLLTRAISED